MGETPREGNRDGKAGGCCQGGDSTPLFGPGSADLPWCTPGAEPLAGGVQWGNRMPRKFINGLWSNC